MDKQEAINYIHQMLDQDHSREEIVRGLVDQLRAPEAIVTKFVAQTEAEHRKNKSQKLPEAIPPQPVKLPPWLEELSTGQELSYGQPSTQPTVEPTAAYPSTPIPASPSWESEAEKFVTSQLQYGRLDSDIADELADRVGISQSRAESFVAVISSRVHSATPVKISNTTEAADFVKAEVAKGHPKLEIVAELAARTGEPQNLTEKFVSLTIAKLEKSKDQAPPQFSVEPPIDLNKPAIVNYVVSELTKNRKRSDIVMAICERTGVNWSEAQRFVGQVSAEQHTAINARKNRLIIPMCIGAVILGFIFTIGTVYPMIYWITGRTAEFISKTQSMSGISNYIQAAPYIFLTGIGMVAGGVMGLIMAMRSQME